MNRKKIGEYISFLRKKNNLTQEELAKKIYVTRQAVSKWEQGKSIPDSSSLERLSEVFNVPVENFIVCTYDDDLEKVDNASVFLSLPKDDSNYKNKRIDQGKSIIFDNLTVNNIWLDFYDDKIKLTNSFRKKIKMALFVIAVLIMLILCFLITSLYNAVNIYIFNGENEKFVVTDSLIITTRNKCYLQIGQITNKNDLDIKEIELYYFNNNNDRVLIFREQGDSDSFSGISLRDNIGYNSYFDVTKISDILKKLTIDFVLENGDIETLELNAKKEDISKFFNNYDVNEVVEKNESDNLAIDNELTNFIENNFYKNDDGYQYKMTENNKEVICDYLNNILFINIESKSTSEFWQFDMLSNYLTYQKYKNSNLIEEVSMDILSISNNNQKYYNEFDNILNKIKSNFN